MQPNISSPVRSQDLSPKAEADLTHLHVAAHDRHPFTTLLRQGLINELLLRLNVHHDRLIRSAAKLHGIPDENLAKGLCVKGSATIPPSLRRALDLDFTVDIGWKYDPINQQKILGSILEIACANQTFWSHPGIVTLADLSSPLFSQNIQQLKNDKIFTVIFVSRTLTPQDAGTIFGELAGKFDIPPNELGILGAFSPALIKLIVEDRIRSAAKAGLTYVPSAEERVGAGLNVVLSVEVSALDNLNVYAPYLMGGYDRQFFMSFTDRTHGPETKLSFANPLEEVIGKLFALLTSHERAVMDEPHTRDLVDLYIRTRSQPYHDRAYAPFRPTHRAEVPHAVRMYWPAHPAFFNGQLHFKKIDPTIGSNIKQVRRGLLACQAQATIGHSLFGDLITEGTAGDCAKILLEHAWSICQECFGVIRTGSNNDPVYTLDVPKAVNKYWQYCKLTRPLTRAKVESRAAELRADRCLGRMKALIRDMVDHAIAPEAINTGALNAYLQADRARHWAGIVRR